MIVGLYQVQSPKGDLRDALEAVSKAMGFAAASGVDMLVFPEIFLPGYGAVTATRPHGWEEVAQTLSDLCTEHGLGITIGLPDYHGNKVSNCALAIGSDGQVLAKYRKVQLFGEVENALYTPGEAYETFEYQGRTFGLLICYDVEFPEHVRALCKLGAEVILVPTANMMPFVNVNQIMVPARAAENGVTIVYANYCGSEGHLDYVGLSGIYGPDGYLLAGKGRGEGLCIAELPNNEWSEHSIPLSSQITDFKDI